MIGEIDIAAFPSRPFSERDYFPSIRAVYVVRDSSGKVLYVGGTCNLRSRLISHHRKQQFEAAHNASVIWIETEEAAVRFLEAQLIESLRPSLNIRSVPLTEQRVSVTAAVSRKTKRALERLARREKRTVSQTLGRLIERTLGL